MRGSRFAAVVVLVALPVAVSVACYGPTSMRVSVLTDVACGSAPQALVFTGTDTDSVGETSECHAEIEGQSLGDILFAPKDDRGATVKVRVRMAVGGKKPTDCNEATAQGRERCVFASRRFSYTEHESRSLAVRMYGACVGVVCGDGTTCVPNGTPDPCVSDVVACQGSACGLAGEAPLAAAPVDAGTDVAPTPTPDAAVDAGAIGCTSPAGDTFLFKGSTAPFRVAYSDTSVFWVDVPAFPFAIHALRRASGTMDPAPIADANVTGAAVAALAADGDAVFLAFRGAPTVIGIYDAARGSVTYPGVNASGTNVGVSLVVTPKGASTAVALAYDANVFGFALPLTLKGAVPLTAAGVGDLTYAGTNFYAMNAEMAGGVQVVSDASPYTVLTTLLPLTHPVLATNGVVAVARGPDVGGPITAISGTTTKQVATAQVGGAERSRSRRTPTSPTGSRTTRCCGRR